MLRTSRCSSASRIVGIRRAGSKRKNVSAGHCHSSAARAGSVQGCQEQESGGASGCGWLREVVMGRAACCTRVGMSPPAARRICLLLELAGSLGE